LKGHVELTNNWFRIYRDKWTSIITYVFLGALASIIGFVVLRIGIADGDSFMRAFGIVFLFGGLPILFNYPFYRRTFIHGGDIAIEANTEGISISSIINTRLKFFPWEHVSRIVLAEKGNTDSYELSIAPDLPSRSKNRIFSENTRQKYLIIIYLSSNKEWNRKDTRMTPLNYIHRSPEGYHYTYAQYPESHVDMIVSSLQQFSKGMVDIKSWGTVLFNYGSGKEEYSS